MHKRPTHRLRAPAAVGPVVVLVLSIALVRPAAAATPDPAGAVDHIVVIFQENHSFDNLWGSWGPVNGMPVNGLVNAEPARTTQVDQQGRTFGCLPQVDVNLTSPPVPA